MKFKLDDLSSKDRYKVLTGSVVPRPIAWITTLNRNGTINLAPFSYFSLVSTEIPIVSVAMNRVQNTLKDTSQNILDTKSCVLNVVDADLVESMNATSASLPYGVSELETLSLNLQSSEWGDVANLREAKIKMEAQLYSHQVIEDDQQAYTDLFLLKIIHIEIDDAIYDFEKGYIKTDRLRPIARLAGNEYAEMKPVFTLQRPK